MSFQAYIDNIQAKTGKSPADFEKLAEMKGFIKGGKLNPAVKATEITKVDKTNEYRQLNAKKASIEKTLQSLNDLKSKGGQIADFVALNDKILEIEEKAQELGVELGNFDSENEFCTVKFSMYEGETQSKISFIHRVKVALEWTIEYYSIMAVTVLILTVTIFVGLLIIDRLKIISTVSAKMNE